VGFGVGGSDNSLTPQLSATIVSENQVGEKKNRRPILNREPQVELTWRKTAKTSQQNWNFRNESASEGLYG
jgi:hypothetical protein